MSDAPAQTADALCRHGAELRRRALFAEAELSLLRALELEHDCAAAHLELGLTYRALARLEDAVDYFQLAVHFAPDVNASWLALGDALAKLGRTQAAVAAYREALTRAPHHAASWIGLGNLYKAELDWCAAAECYRSATACEPGSADAHCRLGYALYQTSSYAESRASLEAALTLRPDMVEAQHNLGLPLLATGCADDALRAFERALAMNPALLETRACVAHALRELGRLDEAIARYDEVLAADPHFADAIINRSYALLMKQDYAVGWDGYARRFSSGAMAARDFPYPPWQGEPLAGKRILVYAEQGLGDEIMFASCLPDLLALGARCVIECNKRLAALFRRAFPQARVHGADKQDPRHWLVELNPIDYQIAIGSLPQYFRRARAEFPQRRAYFAADQRRGAHWRERLETGPALRIGIAWRGGALRSGQLLRSIALPQWQPLLRSAGATFYALQYGDIAAELDALRVGHGVNLERLGDATDDLDELAAIISSLDLVISVDNTVAHLAGALGKPVWTLLACSPEWRYPRYGSAMPWYPAMRLYHRARGGSWEDVMARVAGDLAGVTRGEIGSSR
jgi:tetratricopeptide (TPR) repeat protein